VPRGQHDAEQVEEVPAAALARDRSDDDDAGSAPDDDLDPIERLRRSSAKR